MKKITYLLLALFLSGQVIAQTGLKKGDTAPVFTAKDNTGKTVNLKSLLKEHQSVLLVFYRGQWCPFCNKQLSHLQDSLQMLTAKNVFVVAVTPETDQNIGKTMEKTHAAFTMVHDEGYKIMKAYQVDYEMDSNTVEQYQKYGLDVAKNNGDTKPILPVPATYLIDRSGKIRFVHFDKDFRNRASVKDIMAAL